MKAAEEGALMRGALASGFAYGALHCGMSQFYDYLKEYIYYFFGATQWLRPLILLPTAALGAGLFLPFDNIKVRFHTMSRLPNGAFPYTGFYDAIRKVLIYECNFTQYSSIMALHSGFIPMFVKLYATLLIGVNVTDYAFNDNWKESDFVKSATYYDYPEYGYIKHEHGDVFTDEVIQDLKPKKTIKLGFNGDYYIKH
jgi:hypothetical protein